MPTRSKGRNRDARLRVLLLEASPDTAALMVNELERSGVQVNWVRVDTEAAFVGSLRSLAPDLILVTPSLPGLDVPAALRVVQALRPTAPLIVVAETLDHQTAVTSLRAGAEDVVLTSNASRLGPVTRRALSVRQPLKRLSRRQLEVLRLVSEGRTTRQMAEWLGVSAKTVETHRGAMTKRLGIREVARQVRYAVRVGLISAGDPAEGVLRVNADEEDKVAVIAAWRQAKSAVSEFSKTKPCLRQKVLKAVAHFIPSWLELVVSEVKPLVGGSPMAGHTPRAYLSGSGPPARHVGSCQHHRLASESYCSRLMHVMQI